jgi:hypothetical protein
MTMAVEMIPGDLKLRNLVGRQASIANLERGDTVTFMYEGELRTVLVLENEDGVHVKGVAKERQGDFRNYLRRKISGLKYAKPFVKAVPVTTVHFELLPEVRPVMACDNNVSLTFTRKNGDVLRFTIYRDGSANIYLNDKAFHPYAINNYEPQLFAKLVSEFLAG